MLYVVSISAKGIYNKPKQKTPRQRGSLLKGQYHELNIV